MAAIVLRRFGGMAPSANQKTLDDSVALYTQNLNLRFSDFRPLPAAEGFGAATPGGTLYRFETWGYFITKPGVVNFVRGPIPNDTFERTYYTGDGAPKIIDATNSIRQLGVPQPSAAPVCVVNVTEQYDEEAAAKALGTKQTEIATTVWDNCDEVWAGPSDADLTRFYPGPTPYVFGFQFPGTVVGGAFVPTNPNHSVLQSDRLGYHQGILGATPYGFADLILRGSTISLNATLESDLANIADPSDLTGVTKLLTGEQVDAVIADLTNALKPADKNRDATVLRIQELKNEYVLLADTGSSASLSAVERLKTFYARSDVVSQIDDAVTQAANSVIAALVTYATDDGITYQIP